MPKGCKECYPPKGGEKKLREMPMREMMRKPAKKPAKGKSGKKGY